MTEVFKTAAEAVATFRWKGYQIDRHLTSEGLRVLNDAHGNRVFIRKRKPRRWEAEQVPRISAPNRDCD